MGYSINHIYKDIEWKGYKFMGDFDKFILNYPE